MPIDIENLNSALESLKSGAEELYKNAGCPYTDMLEDSCVKRFEYTYEISWKMMKRVLKEVYGKTEQELTLNNIFRFMQGYGFITNWENWRGYAEKRNTTAHEYSLEKSRKLLEILPQFIKDCEELTANLGKNLK